jgi:transposase-like protein
MSRDGDERKEMPDPEVVPIARRQRFTASEKLRILEEAEACTEPGEIGALVRREGIYSSYQSRWRRAQDRGQLTALGAQQRGPKPATDAALTREVARLRREKERLRARDWGSSRRLFRRRGWRGTGGDWLGRSLGYRPKVRTGDDLLNFRSV